MSSQRGGVGRYSVLIVGLILVLGGVATLATFLAAAGAHLSAQAAILALASVCLFTVGFVLLTRSVRRRGGLLDATPTTAERATYHASHRARGRSRFGRRP